MTKTCKNNKKKYKKIIIITKNAKMTKIAKMTNQMSKNANISKIAKTTNK